jgi:acetylglutamate kinase
MALTLVKCGGAALAKEPFVLAHHVVPGEDVVVVHGGGARITVAMQAAGFSPTFVDGRRVTPEEALPIVREALRSENQALCFQIGARARGVLGDELGLEADRLAELGHVGILRPYVPPALWRLLAEDCVPVIAPLARGPLNVNADDAAAALAVALRADRLVFVSDVPGVFVAGDVVQQLSVSDIVSLRGELSGGIVPKLQAAVRAAKAGVQAEVGQTRVVA